MGEARMAPSDNKAFNPSSPDIPIAAPPEPQLGKVFQFDPIVPRRPRPLPEVPVPKDIVGATGMYPQPQAAPPAPPVKPPVVATAAPDPEDEPERKISADRLAFLERVEALVGAESKINDLESENRLLVSMVARLQKENDVLKKGKA